MKRTQFARAGRTPDYSIDSLFFCFLDQKIVAWDGQWRHVQIPLQSLVDGGSWDNNAWFTPQGLFAWSAVDAFDIVPECHSLAGMQFWFDDIRIAKPPGVR